MAVETAQIERYLESFTEFARRTAQSPEWLRKLREDAFARFCATGFPTTRDEDWRFTNLSALARTPFRLAQPGRERLDCYRSRSNGAWKAPLRGWFSSMGALNRSCRPGALCPKASR